MEESLDIFLSLGSKKKRNQFFDVDITLKEKETSNYFQRCYRCISSRREIERGNYLVLLVQI